MLRNSLKVLTNFAHPYQLIRIPYGSLGLKTATLRLLGPTKMDILNVEVFDCEERMLKESYFTRIDLYVYCVEGGILYCRKKAEKICEISGDAVENRNSANIHTNRESALPKAKMISYRSLLASISSYINDTIADAMTKLRRIRHVQYSALFYKLNLIERACQSAKTNSEVFYMCLVKRMNCYGEKMNNVEAKDVNDTKKMKIGKMIRLIKSMDEDRAVEFVVEIINDLKPTVINKVVNTLKIKNCAKQRLVFYKAGMLCLRKGAKRMAVRFLVLSQCEDVHEMVDERRWRTAIFGNDYDVCAIREVLCDEIVRACAGRNVDRNTDREEHEHHFDKKEGNTKQIDEEAFGAVSDGYHGQDNKKAEHKNYNDMAVMEEIRSEDRKLYGNIHHKKIKTMPNKLELPLNSNESGEQLFTREQGLDGNGKNRDKISERVRTLAGNDETLSDILTNALSVKVNVLTLRQKVNDRSMANRLIDNKILNDRTHLKRLLGMCVVIIGRVREMLATEHNEQLGIFEMADRAGNDEKHFYDKITQEDTKKHSSDDAFSIEEGKKRHVMNIVCRSTGQNSSSEKQRHGSGELYRSEHSDTNSSGTKRLNYDESLSKVTGMIKGMKINHENTDNITKALNIIMALSGKQPSYLLPAKCIDLKVINDEGVHKKTNGLFFSTSALLSKPIYYFLSHIVLKVKSECRLLCLIFDNTAVNINSSDANCDRTIKIKDVDGTLVGVVVERNGMFYMVRVKKLKFVKVSAKARLTKLQPNRFLLQSDSRTSDIEVLNSTMVYERRNKKEDVFKIEGKHGCKYKIVYDLNEEYYRVLEGTIEK
ncbi:hypothetical protein VCUG_02233 [Vavraia culicis subsp. floridensis]|uniref:Uncharacterized protein n=1 Tax=Vavraia culicis (isolate floridensis) TaxID=948595 RepID=L2GRI2_VAVCU|nr:uncharacterized protein VCUG_02233 [Vavraia culicis subsp. floridensis]ELA46266.1 hypothetical protein VCUG_02233 [Vavraia culicis subsp. floridensis]